MFIPASIQATGLLLHATPNSFLWDDNNQSFLNDCIAEKTALHLKDTPEMLFLNEGISFTVIV